MARFANAWTDPVDTYGLEPQSIRGKFGAEPIVFLVHVQKHGIRDERVLIESQLSPMAQCPDSANEGFRIGLQEVEIVITLHDRLLCRTICCEQRCMRIDARNDDSAEAIVLTFHLQIDLISTAVEKNVILDATAFGSANRQRDAAQNSRCDYVLEHKIAQTRVVEIGSLRK